MSDTPQQERTEQPTPKRLKDAREKGQVPRSRELTAALVMVCGAATCLLAGRAMLEDLSAVLRAGLSFPVTSGMDSAALTEAFAFGISGGLQVIAPLLIVLLAVAVLAPTLTGGWSFSVKAMAPKLDKLSPLKGLKRIFGAKGLVELLKALAKALVVTGVAIMLLLGLADQLLSLGSGPVGPALDTAAGLVGGSLLILSASLVLIAAVDVPFQLWNHKRQLKMTLQEVKDELKDTDGRPEVRSRLRALQQERARQRMLLDVPTADVVITNPTHYAVALKYDDALMRAPVVIAKGVDEVAARIREIADTNGVPLFEAPPLARALFRSADINDEIPPRLYAAVAQVLTWIYQLREVAGGGEWPERPSINIDEETEG
ncbi:MAG: flagellar biosynthesis protein FlhB [Gammaproteobacteria bacterium]|nr:flagellar biosynthesis protein FlhB [Gammaproteobacteria bacterium]